MDLLEICSVTNDRTEQQTPMTVPLTQLLCGFLPFVIVLIA